jgi:hypothetical protein
MAAKKEKNARNAASWKRKRIAKTESTTASEINGSRSGMTHDS